MGIVLLEYIETKEYGKIAHFIDEDGKHIFSKVLNSDDAIYYQELSKEEFDKIKDDIE